MKQNSKLGVIGRHETEKQVTESQRKDRKDVELKVDKVFLTDIMIHKVRHLTGLHIHLSGKVLRNVIITGKNGSGKTSLLDAMARELKRLTTSEYKDSAEEIDVVMEFNTSVDHLCSLFARGELLLAYYRSDRAFDAFVPEHVEKVDFQDCYTVDEYPGQRFVQYLLDLKMTQALAISSGRQEKALRIQEWFEQLEKLLGRIFEDEALVLDFNEDTFHFVLKKTGKEPFDS